MASTGVKLDKFLMKKSNRQLIFSIINRKGAVSRVQLAKLSNLSVMSVGRLADELIKLGIVVEEESGNSKVRSGVKLGRKPKLLRIATNNFLSVGVEIYRDGINAGVINFEGRVLKQIQYHGQLDAKPILEVLKKVADMIQQILSESQNLPVIPAVGIACPGLIDNGIIHFSAQLKWHNVAIVQELKKLTGLKDIVIDNEVKARAIAEDLFGMGKEYQRSVVLHIGSGIGSSIMINHTLYRGRSNMAGEIGHICISPAGNMCECGRRGCLQTYIADWAILREARAVRQDITLEGVFEAYDTGEPWAVNLINRALEYTSITISMLANTYAPDVIILCGSLIEENPTFRDLLLKSYKNEINDYMLKSFKLRVSNFGSDGTIVGAGTLAYYNVLDEIM